MGEKPAITIESSEDIKVVDNTIIGYEKGISVSDSKKVLIEKNKIIKEKYPNLTTSEQEEFEYAINEFEKSEVGQELTRKDFKEYQKVMDTPKEKKWDAYLSTVANIVTIATPFLSFVLSNQVKFPQIFKIFTQFF